VKISSKGNQFIIFIPGFACSGEVWNETKSAFENDYTCHVLTMAGFSGVPAQVKPSFETLEKGIAVYIKDNKITRPIVIGHSMGEVLPSHWPQIIRN